MPEIWKPVVGYEGGYEVSSCGRVRSLDREVRLYNGGRYIRKGHDMHPTKDTFGHTQIRLCSGSGNGKMWQVHVLVATAFIGPRSDGYHTRHLNGNPADNRLENLAYGTASENQIDIYRYGGCRKLHAEDVGRIKRLLAEGNSHRAIARRYPAMTASTLNRAKRSGSVGAEIADVRSIHTGSAMRD